MNLKEKVVYGRDNIDPIAESRAHLNSTLYSNAEITLAYLHGVQTVTKKLKFDSAKKDKNTKYPLIYDIVASVAVMDFRDEESGIKFIDKAGNEIKFVNAHPKIIALIKVCIASSISDNVDYYTVVSAFVNELLSNAENLKTPIDLPKQNKYQKLLGESLNNYFVELCNENNIKLNSVIDSPKKSSKKAKELFDTIGLVNG